MSPDFIKTRIETAIPGAQVEVRDLTGTGDHFEARVITDAFTGKSMLDQHRLVYEPLKDVLATGELHALALKTYSTEQWNKSQSK